MLIITISVCMFLILNHSFIVTPILIIVVIIFQTATLYKYIDRGNRYFLHLLKGIQHNDFSFNISENTEHGKQKELAIEINNLLKQLREIGQQKDDYRIFIDHIINKIPLAVVVCKDYNGEILFANSLSNKLTDLASNEGESDFNKFIKSISQGDRLHLIDSDNTKVDLFFKQTEFILRSSKYYVYTIQNLSSTLEDQEMISWSSLIRILTHEIMNSLTPITSLSSTAKSLYNDWINKNNLGADDDLYLALDTIETRSKGLMEFVNAYRMLAKIPQPSMERFKAKPLLERTAHLLQNEFQVDIQVDAASDVTINADKQLIEQVLINIIKNSIESVEHSSSKVIHCIAKAGEDGRCIITISDTGCGIEAELLDQIFIPFFTTKNDGCGIGLSFCKQIMRLHQGNIEIESVADKGTTVRLLFQH